MLYNQVKQTIKNQILGTYSIRIKLSDETVGYVRKITKTSCGYRLTGVCTCHVHTPVLPFG